MTDQSNKNEVMDEGADGPGAKRVVSVRIWPAAAIAIIHIVAALALSAFGTTNNIENGIAFT